MASPEPSRRLHLNRAGEWLDFEYRGLTLGPDGSLELATLPRLIGIPPPHLGSLPEPGGPAGLAIGADGALYLTDPATHRLLGIGPCEHEPAPVPCAGGAGPEPTRFAVPRGVLLDERRNTLLVADTGNNRLQLFDRDTYQLLSIWGQPDRGPAGAGPEPGRLNAPTALAADPEGFVYVIDNGNHRVQKFSPSGAVVASFWERLRTEAKIEPVAVAVSTANSQVEIWILDHGGRLLVVDQNGRQLFLLVLPHVERPLGLAVDREEIYVGDNGRRRILKYDAEGEYLGEADGYEGPVASLAVDGRGGLVVHPGVPPVVRLSLRGARRRRGVMWGGPFQNRSGRRDQWHQVKLAVSVPSSEARVQLFVRSSATDAAPPVDEAAADPFGGAWTPIGVDAPAAIVPATPFDNLWIGVQLSSEGADSVTLQDIQVDFDYRSYLGYLPAVFREDAVSRDFLVRLLALLQTATDDAGEQIDRLPALFDARAAPRAWLPWLASWLAYDLDANWPEEKGRAAVAGAFEASAWRGTSLGLARTLRFLTGLHLRIVEPILDAGWWALAEENATGAAAGASILGYSTRLVATEPQGAVLDTTAVLDGSHLVAGDAFGTAMFDEVAHRFTVNVYRGAAFSEALLDRLRQLIEREKPAHTRAEVCVVEPLMRAGIQARIGIDSIVAQTPGRGPGSGQQARIGQGLRVGEVFTG
jgi:phage tail-like protein